MNQRNRISQIILAVAGLVSLIPAAQALPFVYKQADLVLGFRKTGTYQGNNETVVDLGSVTNYLNLAVGSSVTVTNYSASQVSPDSFSTLNNLSWSVSGCVNANNLPGYARNTLYITVPRATNGVPAVAPARLDSSVQQSAVSYILSIFNGAVDISARLSANQDNTATFVQEPLNLPNTTQGENYGAFMGGVIDSTQGTLQDNWTQNNLEKTTPSSFTTPVQSDLYEVRPNGVVDPHTGLSSGTAYYAGYFQLNVNGTLTFTRDTNSVVTPIVIAPPVLALKRLGTTSTISFASTNGATYTLYYTNLTGLNQPVSTWPSLPGTLAGDGTVKSFTDTTTDSNRVYKVSGH